VLVKKQISSSLNQGRIRISSSIDFFKKKEKILLKVQPLPPHDFPKPTGTGISVRGGSRF